MSRKRTPIDNVDYLSYCWGNELDLATSWRVMTKNKDTMINGRRLENASWRKWFQQRYSLPLLNPAELNWFKDSDVCWLYGPMHLHDDIKKKTKSQDTTNNSNLKSVLKKPSLDEFRSTLENLRKAKIALDNNNKLNITKSKKHLRFNTQVEQRISVNINPEIEYVNSRFQHSALNKYLNSVAEEESDEDDEEEESDIDEIEEYEEENINSNNNDKNYSDDDDEDEDDELPKNRFSNLKRNYSLSKKVSFETTIKLPPTTLKSADDDSDNDLIANNFTFDEYEQEFENSTEPITIDNGDIDILDYNENNSKYVRLSTSSPAVTQYDYKVQKDAERKANINFGEGNDNDDSCSSSDDDFEYDHDLDKPNRQKEEKEDGIVVVDDDFNIPAAVLLE